MKKTIYLKSIFLLCLLLAGVVNAHADDYEWVKVTDLSKVESGDEVVLIGENEFALKYDNPLAIFAYSVTISDDKILDENVVDGIKWKLTKQVDETFKFATLNGANLSVDFDYENNVTIAPGNLSNPDSYTTDFSFENYGDNGGKLYFGSYRYIKLDNNKAVVGEPGSTFTLYKKTVKKYVKWKRVGIDDIEEGDTVAIVDLTTATAMSNDKADKDPDAVAVTLNDDKDRILDEVAAKLKWKVERDAQEAANSNKRRFATGDNKYLYADGEQLKVGDGVNNLFYPFTWEHYDDNGVLQIIPYLCFRIGDDRYLAGVEEGFMGMGNTWKLKKYENGKVDDAVKDTRYAYFKKFEDTQRIVKIELPEYYNYDFNKVSDYTIDAYDFNEKVTITGADKSEIKWKSSNPGVATINAQGAITLIKRGTTVITAYVEETDIHGHDKASAKCTVIVDDNRYAELGSIRQPLTVAEAKELAETGEIKIDDDFVVLRWEEGVNYYIKGKVSKVNSGMMAMFGDMDFGEMMGGSGSEDSMDDMDFDPEDMEESGFDMSSFDMSSLGFDMSAMFGTSDKVTYYISDDGTKDGQMKVINGCGTLSEESAGGTMVFNPIPKLSPGDCVVVCGPLVNTEDTNMFSGMMGGNSSDEPKMSGKVDEMNYLVVYDPTLLVKDTTVYVNKSLKVVDGGYEDYLLQKGLYSIDNLFEKFDVYNDEVKITDLSQIKEATFKSSDEDIVKWDEDKKELVGVNEGKAKITVKVKVVLQEKDDNADPKVEEKSYTMKRKFKVIVKTRDLDPAGYYDGEWVLTTQEEASELKEGTRLVLVGTRVKDDKATDYMMVENNAMMGGGKNGSKIEFDEPTIPSSTVTSKKGLEVVLEKADENGTSWYLNVGQDENGEKLYLYASEKKKEESQNDDENQNTGGFNMEEMMEMFNPSSGLKVGTKAGTVNKEDASVDSLKATITIDANSIATIKFPTAENNNTIMLTSSFDMESMMEMFGGMGGNNNEEQDPNDPNQEDPDEKESTFDMGSFDMFMASFNTKKPGDEQPTVDEETGETKDPKCFMPRIYRFVPYDTYDITIGSSEWKTIVSYKDVKVPENVEAYIVTKVTPKETQSVASLKPVQIKDGKQVLKGGEPYLLHYTSQAENYTMTLLTPNDPDQLEAPEGNLLKKSDRKTKGDKDGSSVYVLADKPNWGVGFYKWQGGELGSGRVYLESSGSAQTVAHAHEFIGFLEEEEESVTTDIQSLEGADSVTGPFYDLQGRRVNKPTKGVYIVNGKKVIVK